MCYWCFHQILTYSVTYNCTDARKTCANKRNHHKLTTPLINKHTNDSNLLEILLLSKEHVILLSDHCWRSQETAHRLDPNQCPVIDKECFELVSNTKEGFVVPSSWQMNYNFIYSTTKLKIKHLCHSPHRMLQTRLMLAGSRTLVTYKPKIKYRLLVACLQVLLSQLVEHPTLKLDLAIVQILRDDSDFSSSHTSWTDFKPNLLQAFNTENRVW